MPSIVETLVSLHVRSQNRRALLRMRELRHALLDDLEDTDPPPREALDQVHRDVRAIEEGLKQL